MPQVPENSNPILYKKIYSELKAEILAGTYAKGDWFPPERVLKDRFGTTHLTVRSALAKLVQEGYIERYSGKGTLVIYSRSGSESDRPALRFPSAHLILADLDETGTLLLDSIEAQLRRISLPLCVSLHRGDPAMERSLHALATEAKALTILQPAESPQSVAHSAIGLENTILVGTGEEVSAGAGILIDDESGAREAVRYLLDLGHRAIALVCPPTGASGLRRGWESTLTSAGFEDAKELQLTCAEAVEPSSEAVSSILIRFPACRAFICGSDRIAAGACRALRKAGMEAGEDAAIIGYGNTPLAEALDLASIDPRLAGIGELVAAIVDRMRRGRLPMEAQCILPRLVIRDSCCRWPPVHRGRALGPR
jgi:DNA-binding LacI/PurR family transcriptional regulator/DNA-binding transcriptional regulator YhcF (GntR family)